MSDNNVKTPNLNDYVKTTLNKKLKTDNRIDVSNHIDENENKNNKQKREKFSLKKWWKKQTITNQYAEQSKNLKNIYTRCVIGATMGTNSVFYGSSTSLFACQFKNFKDIIDGWCDFFSPKSLKDFLWKFAWLLPFIISFIIALIILYVIDYVAFINGFELGLIFLTIGIGIIGSILLIVLPKNRPQNFFGKNKEEKIKKLLFLIIPMIVMFGIAFAARYAWIQEYPFNHITNNQFLENNQGVSNISSIITNNSLSTEYAIQLLIASFLAGLTTFIPGTSGSFILAVIGSNSFINTAVRFIFFGYTGGIENISISWAWSTIIITFIGVLLGFIASAFGYKYLLEKYNEYTKIISVGFSFILFISIFISLQNIDYNAIANNNGLLICCLILLLIPMVIVIPLILWFKRNELIVVIDSFKENKLN